MFIRDSGSWYKLSGVPPAKLITYLAYVFDLGKVWKTVVVFKSVDAESVFKKRKPPGGNIHNHNHLVEGQGLPG